MAEEPIYDTRNTTKARARKKQARSGFIFVIASILFACIVYVGGIILISITIPTSKNLPPLIITGVFIFCPVGVLWILAAYSGYIQELFDLKIYQSHIDLLYDMYPKGYPKFGLFYHLRTLLFVRKDMIARIHFKDIEKVCWCPNDYGVMFFFKQKENNKTIIPIVIGKDWIDDEAAFKHAIKKVTNFDEITDVRIIDTLTVWCKEKERKNLEEINGFEVVHL